MDKIIRTICYFAENPNSKIIERLNEIEERLSNKGFQIQTKRACIPNMGFQELETKFADNSIFLGTGELSFGDSKKQLGDFLASQNVAFNLDLSSEEIKQKHAEVLFKIIKERSEHTFRFTYGFNLPGSSPYYPSAKFDKKGFSIGLQPTNLAKDCKSLEEWLEKSKNVWNEIVQIFSKEKDFLGIDSSVAPLFDEASLVGIIKKFGQDFNQSVLSDIYLKVTQFIKSQNPKPVGLCGMMLPCLEDSELAKEYEKGNFSIERNLFLSLHSGLGVDTYPIGINEEPNKILGVLKLTQGLSKKYNKPLSVRFVSDGKTRIGDKSDFNNQYLRDVVIRGL